MYGALKSAEALKNVVQRLGTAMGNGMRNLLTPLEEPWHWHYPTVSRTIMGSRLRRRPPAAVFAEETGSLELEDWALLEFGDLSPALPPPPAELREVRQRPESASFLGRSHGYYQS